MLLVPYVTGMIAGGARWEHLPLLAVWVFGYCMFFTATNWVKARRRPAYLAPVRFWGISTAIAGIAALYWCFELLPWGRAFVILTAITAWETLGGRDRSLLARSSEVFAAGLMGVVAWYFGGQSTDGALLAMAFMTYYFWSTIPFVKSLVREKRSRLYHWLSIGAHVLGLGSAVVMSLLGYWNWMTVGFWAIVCVRAVLFTHVGNTKVPREIPTKRFLVTLGLLETALSLVAMAIILVG